MQDTTDALWESSYLVRVPSLQARSREHVALYGVYITGIKNIDQALANDWMTTYMSIARMVELFDEGVAVRIVKESDVQRIYEAIEAHLRAWSAYLQKGVNVHDAPIEDLLAMDRFAQSLFPYAKPILKAELHEGTGLHFAKRFSASPMSILAPPTPEEPADLERQSLAEYLKARAGMLRR